MTNASSVYPSFSQNNWEIRDSQNPNLNRIAIFQPIHAWIHTYIQTNNVLNKISTGIFMADGKKI